MPDVTPSQGGGFLGDVLRELSASLRTPTRRAAALRRLASPATSGEMRSALLQDLIFLVAHRHSNYEAAISVLRLVPLDSLDRSLWDEMSPFLDGSDSEPFVQFAQVLELLDRPADLRRLVERARTFEDLDIREVADDFG